LNSNGGYVLIGVKDDKTILGLKKDFSFLKKATTDSFELHFTNIVNKYLGTENRPCVTMRFAKIGGKIVSVVIIPKRSPREVYLTLEGQPFFYIRSGNSSQPLDVKQAPIYIKEHWGART
jgi:predicted HTH transcriptional regulator